VVLNNTDLVSPAEVGEITREIRTTNGHVVVLPAVCCDVDLAEIFDVGAFDLDAP
jgi:G3E family GTPase